MNGRVTLFFLKRTCSSSLFHPHIPLSISPSCIPSSHCACRLLTKVKKRNFTLPGVFLELCTLPSQFNLESRNSNRACLFTADAGDVSFISSSSLDIYLPRLTENTKDR